MSGWYWLLWGFLTVVNVVVWLGSRHNLRETRRLLRVHQEHRTSPESRQP